MFLHVMRRGLFFAFIAFCGCCDLCFLVFRFQVSVCFHFLSFHLLRIWLGGCDVVALQFPWLVFVEKVIGINNGL